MIRAKERIREREREREIKTLYFLKSESKLVERNSLSVLAIQRYRVQGHFLLESFSISAYITVRVTPMNIGMETTLGRGYSMNEDFGVADFYSPPSSIVDELEELDDDLFYPGDEAQEGDEQQQQQPPQQQQQPFSSDTPLPLTLVDEMSSLNLSKSFHAVATVDHLVVIFSRDQRYVPTISV